MLPINDFIKIAKDIGFEVVLEESFVHPRSNEHEKYFILFQPVDCILLSFDSIRDGALLNGGNYYYNWEPKFYGTGPGKGWMGSVSSGHMHKEHDVWVGYHDCRYDMKRTILGLRKDGRFINPWIEQPLLWLLHYGDKRCELGESEKISADRISRLPISVQTAIRGEYSEFHRP